MKLLKDRGLHSLCNEFSTVRNFTTTHVNVLDKKIVVTIPDDLELTEAETSALSKGLTFVPMNNKIENIKLRLIVRNTTAVFDLRLTFMVKMRI